MRFGPKQVRDAPAKRGDLRECEIHEDHATGQHVPAERWENQRQQKTGKERQRHHGEETHWAPPDFPDSAPATDETRTSNLEKTSSVPGRPPASVAISTATPPALLANSRLASAL